MHMITEERPAFHQMFSRRILYVGHDLALLEFLRDAIEDCQIVRCPNGSQARLFIQGIDYSLLLLDEALPDTTGAVLSRFTRELARREHTPVVICKPSSAFRVLAKTLARLLAARKARNYFADNGSWSRWRNSARDTCCV
jgi:hypothetical protein